MLRSINVVTDFSKRRSTSLDLDTMAMPDLLQLFEEHMNIHGRSELVGVIRGINNNNNQINNTESNSDGLEDDNNSDASGFGDDDETADSADDDSSLEGSENSLFDAEEDDANSEVSSVAGENLGGGLGAEFLTLHDAVDHDFRHCPPFPTIESTLHGDCDCADYGMVQCCRENNFSFFHRLNFDEEYQLSLNSVMDMDRLPSNLLRKRLYKHLFHETDIGLLEKHERRKLPNCAVARVRQIYPNTEGQYMGYREN
jgi:hypothetical protein